MYQVQKMSQCSELYIHEGHSIGSCSHLCLLHKRLQTSMRSSIQSFCLVKNVPQRHSVLDLSTCNEVKQETKEVPPSTSLGLHFSHRAVASKRRLSASKYLFQPPRQNITSFDDTTKDEPVQCAQDGQPDVCIVSDSHVSLCNGPTSSCNEGSLVATTLEYPMIKPSTTVPYDLLKHLEEHACAIYEPVVTHQSYSSLTVLFSQCIDYLKEYSNHVHDAVPPQPVSTTPPQSAEIPLSVSEPSCIPTKESIDALLRSLQTLFNDYQSTLEKIDQNDNLLTALLYGIEHEHKELYEFQQQLCAKHGKGASMNIEGKKSSEQQGETFDEAAPQPSPFPLAKLRRLEALEEAKKHTQRVFEQGLRLCEQLDNNVSFHTQALSQNTLYQVLSALNVTTEIIRTTQKGNPVGFPL